MSTALTLFAPGAQLPAHLAAFEGKDNVLPRDTTPAITFRGKTWRLRQGGEEIVLTRKNNDGDVEPATVVKVVVLNLNQKRSRMMYPPYEEGKNQAPICWSSDGDRPDKEVPTPCAATCASCPNSVKGSKITANQKETTACSPVKRVAVVPAGKLDMEPLLLKIPQTSMWDKNNPEAEAQGYFAWDQYVDFLRQRGVKHTAAVVTKIKFDPNVAYPKLLFTAEKWLEADEVAKIVPLVDCEAVKKLLTGKINEALNDAEDAVPAAAPAPAAQAPVTAPAAAPAPVPAPAVAPAPVPAPTTPPLAAKPAPAGSDDDGGDAFANVGAKPAAAAATKPAAAAKAPPAPPQPPAPPKPPVAGAPAATNPDLAALAAAWDD